MDKAVIYIHGKGGDAEEALHYKSLFSDCDVIGLDYTAQFPWEAKEEFPLLFNSIYRNYKTVEIIANSIGAYFANCSAWRGCADYLFPAEWCNFAGYGIFD